jgi:hypothetical protein
MVPTEQQPEGSRKLLTDLAPWADSLSKGVAAIAIAVYACGFLIVSLHHSKYGFIGTNLFRPHIVAAGAWFVLFLAIPITAAAKYTTLSWTKIAQDMYFFWIASFGLSISFSIPLFTFEAVPTVEARHIRWWFVAIIAVSLLGTIGLLRKNLTATFASVVLLGTFVVIQVRWMILHHFDLSAVALWFFGVFVVATVEIKMRSQENLAEAGQWAKPLGTLLVVLLIFSEYYYPNLKSSWGGGAPVSVTIYFTKDSAISPSKAVSAQLIEESDEGFYIVGPKETRAIFVPRSSVALVYFSDKIADSLLLRDGK